VQKKIILIESYRPVPFLKKVVDVKNAEDFESDLEKLIVGNVDPKISRDELLEDVFKLYVAKLFELVMVKSAKKDRLEFDGVVSAKRNLINAFRSAKLAEYQKSVEWYEALFEKTVKEILEGASHRHGGVDTAVIGGSMEINKEAYIRDGGLFVPEHLRKSTI